jgi:hypothetical protein
LVTGRLRQTIVRNGKTGSVEVVSWTTEVWRERWMASARISSHPIDRVSQVGVQMLSGDYT